MICCMNILIGWLRPYLSLFVDPYCWMAAPIPHIHVSEILVVFVHAGLPRVVFGSNVFS